MQPQGTEKANKVSSTPSCELGGDRWRSGAALRDSPLQIINMAWLLLVRHLECPPQGPFELTQVVEPLSRMKQYALTWSFFASWCSRKQQNPVDCLIGTVLEFLQECFSVGISLSTLKVYMADLSVYRASQSGPLVGRLPHWTDSTRASDHVS